MWPRVIARLDAEHVRGEAAVRELQHLLLAWELMGRGAVRCLLEALALPGLYREHMRLEETMVLPAAQAYLDDDDWAAVGCRVCHQREPAGPWPPTRPGV